MKKAEIKPGILSSLSKRSKAYKAILRKLKKDGRRQFPKLQSNCSAIVQMSDSELAPRVKVEAEMFGAEVDAEAIRANARYVQDKLDRQGVEAYALEYAKDQIKNFSF